MLKDLTKIKSAQESGTVVENARKELERKSGNKVSTKQNYLNNPQSKKFIDN